ncbi:PAS domain-containing sensor histidine kinase [Luteolibacter luteus]|uniref:histidine kinase n=1 Tax=Luteolibacter luteus TaxID=2728835 RepID=A0A858RQL6_9BACT|nr:PAS domain S-box protein [Luteolibacter luteus]QJE98931.1 PAS domain S-box protein [Luteolibacter luteus]
MMMPISRADGGILDWLPAMAGGRMAEVWKEHPQVMAGIVAAVLIQSALIFCLLIASQRRQRAERQLRVSEERYRMVLESQTEMVCRYRTDMVLTFVNEAYCRFFGRTREELIGTCFLELIPETLHNDVRETVRRIVEQRKPIVNSHPVIRADGGVGWMEWEDHPVLNERGELEELQGIGRDVSERERTQEALRQSEERFAGIFRGCPIAIAIIRQSDGRFVEVNPSWERFFEIDRARAIGASPVELGLVGSKDAEERFQSFLASGQPLNGFEQPVITPGGETRWASMSCELISLAGEPCFVVMSKDVTGHKELEDARQGVVQAMRLAMLGELTASIAHEINQPLGAILGNAETAEFLLAGENPPIEELRLILGDIRRDDLRASEVIKRVRSLVGRREFTMAPKFLNEILTDVMRLVAHDSMTRGVTLVTDFEMNLPPVSCDSTQVEQVMLNLILNAMDAVRGVAPASRRVQLRSARLPGGELEASVTDNGHGIAPEKLDRIFDSFFTTKTQGMGLGLALARSIAESHGGRLTAENNAAGGATFRLILPVHEGPVSPNKP